MKQKLFLLFIFITIYTMTIAQQISVSDMIAAVKCKDKNCFNAVALSKKFFFFTTMTDVYSDAYIYTNDNNINSVKAVDFSINFYKPPVNQETLVSVGVRHNLKDYFILLLKQAAESGFVPDKNVKDPAAYFGTVTYRSKKYPGLMFNATVRKDDRNLTQYYTDVEMKGNSN